MLVVEPISEGELADSDVTTMSDIYERSFPAGERDDTEGLLSELAAGRRWGWIIRSSGDLIGFAILSRLEAQGVDFLEYMAVAPDQRNSGAGGTLLDAVIAGRRSAGSAGIAFEVEHPETAAGEEAELRRRRIGFYERHGAAVVECAPSYQAPNLAEDGTLPFLLMWIGLEEPGPPRGERLRGCVRSMLVDGYGLAEDDPVVAAALAGLTC